MRVSVRAGSKRLGEFEVCSSFLARARGLMFRRHPTRLLFVFPSAGMHAIHSLFVFFPFDAIFLDERKRVVFVRKNIPPFTLLVRPPRAIRYLLELPAGKVDVREGEKVVWQKAVRSRRN
ncbi:MAG: DUF192 domain-containing protein [Candidatus Micrarchaeia archaeon]